MSHCRALALGLLLAAVTPSWVDVGQVAVAADVGPEQEAIDSAREALAGGANPWYDSQSDSLRRIEVERTETKKKSESGMSFGWLLEGLAYVLLGAALLAIVAMLVWFALEQRRTRKRAPQAPAAEPTIDEAEALPFLAERPRGDLLGQARRHYEQGNYSEAILYLFSYELVELDRAARIHLTKGKTNREYLRELREAGPLRSQLEQTLLAFESVFFGSRTLDRAGFEACWNQVPDFQARLRAAT